MVIAINFRILSGNSAISKMMIDCFERVASSHTEHEFIFIGEKNFDEQKGGLKNIKQIVLPQQSKNPLLWKLWYNYKLLAVLKKYKADILITADGVCSLRTKLPQYLLVNDLAFLSHPEWYSKKYNRFIKTNTSVFLQKAKSIIVFSNVIKEKIQQQYKVDEKKIAVLYPGVNRNYQPANTEEKEVVKEKYTEGKEYFLFSGAIHPRSNLINLLKAFSLFKKRQKSNMQLIIASDTVSEDKAFVGSLQLYKFRTEIKLLENLDQDLLQKITASAYACINTSPLHTDIASLLNAMQCEVPVIAGNLYAAIEQFGEAALYANESVPEDIAEKLMLLYKDENKRNDLIKKGVQQSAKFNPDATAIQLWQNILATIQPL